MVLIKRVDTPDSTGAVPMRDKQVEFPLLKVAEVTESGYQLYAAEMKTRCEEIKALKDQRLTLEEIKRRY